MAKMTFKGGTANPDFKMSIKQNKYREQRNRLFKISIFSCLINIGLVVYIWLKFK